MAILRSIVQALVGTIFSGRTGDDLAWRAMAALDCITVTLGPAGVIAARDGVFHRAPSLKIDAVDTVGAGDTFCGYLTAGLDEGLDFSISLQRAVCAAALACTQTLAQPAIPRLEEVERVLGLVASFDT